METGFKMFCPSRAQSLSSYIAPSFHGHAINELADSLAKAEQLSLMLKCTVR